MSNVNFNIVGNNVLTHSEEINLINKLMECSDNTISFEVEYTDVLIKTASGKFKYLIQNIK